MIRAVLIISVVLSLHACSRGSGIPEDRFYRLPHPVPAVNDSKLVEGGIFVQRFIADGLYRERPLLYLIDRHGVEIGQHDYHLWIDTPSRLLRDQLIAYLNKAQVSAYVVDTTDVPADLRIHGKLLRFEMEPGNAGVVIKMQFRVDHVSRDVPVLIRDYIARETTSSLDMNEVIQVYGKIIDSIYSSLIVDISAALGDL